MAPTILPGTWRALRELDVRKMPRRSFLQSAVFVPALGKFPAVWVLSQAQPVGRHEHTHYNVFYSNGAYAWTFTVLNGGHGSSFHVRRSAAGNLWAWIGHEDGRTYRVRMRRGKVKAPTWRNGRIVKDGSRDVQHVETFSRRACVPVSVDPWWVVYREAGKTWEKYTLRKEKEVLAGVNKVYGTVTRNKIGPGVAQGSGACLAGIGVVSGHTNKAQTGYFHRWVKPGQKVSGEAWRVNAGALLTNPRPTSHEPEGFTFLKGNKGYVPLIGKRFGSVLRRRFIVYAGPTEV